MSMNELADDFRLLPIRKDGSPDCADLTIAPEIAAMLTKTRDLYGSIGFKPPWISYLALAAGKPVGGGAFVGAPREGAVEIAYFTLPDEQHRGYASMTASLLVQIAWHAAPKVDLWAKTMPEHNASTRVLEKLGFRREDLVIDHEIGSAWCWRLQARGA